MQKTLCKRSQLFEWIFEISPNFCSANEILENMHYSLDYIKIKFECFTMCDLATKLNIIPSGIIPYLYLCYNMNCINQHIPSTFLIRKASFKYQTLINDLYGEGIYWHCFVLADIFLMSALLNRQYQERKLLI